jgi:UTP:GlnB (protein PII) uridylyltransferase
MELQWSSRHDCYLCCCRQRLASDCLASTFPGPDHFGLLFVLSRLLTDRGHVIGVVSISTEGDQVHDDFYITQNGEKLNAKEFLMVSRKLQIFMEDALSHRQDISVIFQ